ncbi:MAG: hypothetical protein K9K35_09970 [Rhodoferax sp.]|nr:hypothetical protein [Rhodoferax sp.]
MPNIVFNDLPLIGSPTPLVFGAPTVSSIDYDAQLVGVIPGLQAAVELRGLQNMEITGTLPQTLQVTALVRPVRLLELAGALPHTFAAHIDTLAIAAGTVSGTLPNTLGAALELLYISNTQRPVVAQSRDTAQIAQPTEHGMGQHWQDSARSRNGFEGRFTETVKVQTPAATRFQDGARHQVATRTTFTEAVHARASLWGKFQEALHTRSATPARFQDGTPARASLTGVFQDGLRDRRAWVATRAQSAVKISRSLLTRGAYGKPLQHGNAARFQEAWVPRPGIHTPPVPPLVPLPTWSAHLLFQCPPNTTGALVFGLICGLPTGTAARAILPARFYMTAHTIHAQRLPDLADIPLYEATLSADSGSYCWSLTASGPASVFEQLSPSAGLPAQVQITLDGLPWVFAIDSIARNTAFGKTGVSVQGRSVTALIAAPYLRSEQRIEPDAKTAQQLALMALANTGIALDWGIGAGALANGGLIDWLVPAGAYSRQGTALEAVSRIVQAAGGYLQSHRSAPTLLARHPYGQRIGDTSGAPWAWSSGAADIELAPDALITTSIRRKDGPDITGVYVSGTSAGVLAWVKRSGTAGDKLAPMLTDSLITHTDAARQAGLAILGAAGPKHAVQLALPVLTGAGQPGVLDVGQLVQINASQPWRARVRAVSVQASAPTLRQTITLERHLEVA